MPQAEATSSSARATARLLVGLHLDGPAIRLAARVLRRAPSSRVASSLGWHLGQAAGPAPRVAHLRDGQQMVVDVRDYAHRHAFLRGIYEPPITALIERLARPGWTVVDVGANAGYHTLLAARLGGPGARVIAFEPDARSGALLRRSMSLNPDLAIELIAAACADDDGTIAFHASDDPRNSGLSHVLDFGLGLSARSNAVPCVRLDGFCRERGLTPELVKIDVEGAEGLVLQGATGLLVSDPPVHVICELWPDSRAAVLELMTDCGYTMHGIADDGSLTAAPPAGAEWSDVCFRHRRAQSG